MEGEQSASFSGHFTPTERILGTKQIGCWVHRSDLGTAGKKKSLFLLGIKNQFLGHPA
jgi:hypothetical protein